MQDSKLHTIIIAIFLMLSIFSFSTSTVVEDSSTLTYEILLDDSSESDDKEEEEQEKKLFTFFQNFQILYTALTMNLALSYKTSQGLTQSDPHFRPPIFS